MRLLLDSHVLLWWWCCPALLSSKVQALLRAPDQMVAVSAASLWELSLAVEEGKLPELAPVIWELPQLVLDEGFALLAINAQHSLLAGHWHTRQAPTTGCCRPIAFGPGAERRTESGEQRSGPARPRRTRDLVNA